MPRQIYTGHAGTSFRNETGSILYQLIVNWHNSCAICIQFDHKVGSYWPIPFHRGCLCKQVPVAPGFEARPFVDYREKITEVSVSQQSAIMGRSNLTMVEAGLVKWSDVVTSGRIRSFREVVSRNKLTVDQMVKAGVAPAQAREAFGAVQTGTHTANESTRNKMVKALLSKGYTREQIRDAAGKAIIRRLSLGIGRSGAAPPLPLPPPIPKPSSAPTPPTLATPPPHPPAPTPQPSSPRPAAEMIAEAVHCARSQQIQIEPNGASFLSLHYNPAKLATIPAAYNSKDSTIYINQGAAYWANAEAENRQLEKSGWWSNGNSNSVIVHEIGHALHHRKLGPLYDQINRGPMSQDRTNLIKAEVSEYGSTSAKEMVAETYAGLVAGKVYNQKVMDLYRKLGGPTP